MFSFFKRKKAPDTPAPEPVAPAAPAAPVARPAPPAPAVAKSDVKPDARPEVKTEGKTEVSVLHEGSNLFPETAERPTTEQEKKQSWMARLKAGLSKTSSNLSLLFVGAKIDEDLYEELEAALLMSDAGMDATEFLLDGLRRKVKEDKLLDAAAVKAALKVLMIDLLLPAGKAARTGPPRAAGDDDRGRQRRRQDHHHRQAGQAHADVRPVGAAGRGRHLPRRRARAADGLGPAQQRHRDLAGIGRPGRRRLRRGPVGQGARHRRGHGRHGRPPADPAAPDGRTEKDQARDRQGHGRRAARNPARHRRQHRPERAGAGQGLRRCAAADRPGRSPSSTAPPRAACWPRSRACARFPCTSSAWARRSKTCSRSTPTNSSKRCSV